MTGDPGMSAVKFTLLLGTATMLWLLIYGVVKGAHPLAILITIVVAGAALLGSVIFVRWFDKWFRHWHKG